MAEIRETSSPEAELIQSINNPLYEMHPSTRSVLGDTLLRGDIFVPVTINSRKLLLQFHVNQDQTNPTKPPPLEIILRDAKTIILPVDRALPLSAEHQEISRRTISFGELYPSTESSPRHHALWAFWEAHKPTSMERDMTDNLVTLYETVDTLPAEQGKGFASYLVSLDRFSASLYLEILRKSHLLNSTPDHALLIITDQSGWFTRARAQQLNTQLPHIGKLSIIFNDEPKQWARVIS